MEFVRRSKDWRNKTYKNAYVLNLLLPKKYEYTLVYTDHLNQCPNFYQWAEQYWIMKIFWLNDFNIDVKNKSFSFQ